MVSINPSIINMTVFSPFKQYFRLFSDITMKRFAPLSILFAVSSFVVISSLPAQAQEGDMFPSKSAALQRAKHLKCSGVFQMGDQWMPCKDFNTYEKAVKNEK